MNYKGANTPIGPNGTHSELIYLVGMGYEGWIDSKFTFEHKGIFVIMLDCIRVSEYGIWIELID